MKLSSNLILLIFPFVLFSAPIWSQQQSISHGGIQMTIPSDWFFQTQSYPNGNETIDSGKRGEPNGFTINKVNADLSTKEGVDLAKSMIAGYDHFKNANYTTYKNDTFNGYMSTETSFSGNLQGTTFKGKILAFKSGSVVYVIMYMGNDSYNKGKILQEILASIEVG